MACTKTRIDLVPFQLQSINENEKRIVPIEEGCKGSVVDWTDIQNKRHSNPIKRNPCDLTHKKRFGESKLPKNIMNSGIVKFLRLIDFVQGSGEKRGDEWLNYDSIVKAQNQFVAQSDSLETITDTLNFGFIYHLLKNRGGEFKLKKNKRKNILIPGKNYFLVKCLINCHYTKKEDQTIPEFDNDEAAIKKDSKNEDFDVILINPDRTMFYCMKMENPSSTKILFETINQQGYCSPSNSYLTRVLKCLEIDLQNNI